MNKVFLDELPMRNKRQVDWVNSVGCKVRFSYNGIKGEIVITEQDSLNKNIKVSYNNKIFTMDKNSLLHCRLNTLFRKFGSEYAYNIGDIINTNTGKIRILKQIRTSNGKKYTQKGYKYECLIDKNVDSIPEKDLVRGTGCNVCANQKVVKGYNDLWTTHPEKARLLENLEDGYNYSYGSNIKVNWICEDCGNIIKNKGIYDFVSSKYPCNRCSDGISYPEKFMCSVLDQINLEYIREYSPNWASNRRYDFYIASINSIIEVHGSQHYEKRINPLFRKTSKEEQENDFNKKWDSLNNNTVNYIVIDASESNIEYIKRSVVNSRISWMYDISKVDWNKCEEFACSSLVKVACDHWNEGMRSAKIIGEEMNMSTGTIIKYLKKGKNIGWCDYDPDEEKILGRLKNAGTYNKIKVVCLNTNEVFESVSNASVKCNADGGNIGYCCKGVGFYSGKDTITGDYLQWQYYDDYLIEPKKLLSNKEIKSKLHTNLKVKVICLNTGEVFDSIADASRNYNVRDISIIKCCKGKGLSAGKDNFGNKLTWMYYDEHAKKSNI